MEAARTRKANTVGSIESAKFAPETPLLERAKSVGLLFRAACWRLTLRCCQKIANSGKFSAITTVLTIYALFGDDMRLLFAEKPGDWIWNIVTIITMCVFSIEVVACSFGKAGYLFGFFFWLDLISTSTLVLDVTTVAESVFGDSISHADDQSSTSARDNAGGDSAEAARAARMSRAGTKAGRVVRLIRIVRLIRLVKLYKKSAYQEKVEVGPPGLEWEDDDDANLEKESAVSKKLSEMTTRRVIMLVLVIMLSLPFFQPTMYVEELPSSAQFGLNSLYRVWRDGLAMHDPAANQTARAAYLGSKEREVYVDDFFMYVYYHNPLCNSDHVPDDSEASPLSNFGRLFWVGVAPLTSSITEFFLPRFLGGTAYNLNDLNARWNGKHWSYFQCNLTSDARAALDTPWGGTQRCLSGTFGGASLIKGRESRLDCPEKLRFQERIVIYPMALTEEEGDELFFMFVFDRRSGSRMEALLNTLQTLFICLLLGCGAMTFSSDANRLVLMPIERMIAKIDRIRNNPLAAMTIGEEDQHREQVAARKSRISQPAASSPSDDTMSSCRSEDLGHYRMRRLWACFNRLRLQDAGPAPEPMETVVLEKTIIKIGSLLALGFGEAGSEIIGQNMRGGDNSPLDAMIPGRRVEAIFGFCEIRNFTDATEVLQDQVMVFVNRIAGVIHTCANEFFGSPNKNIGQAFLLAWRLSGLAETRQQRLADMALISLVKIIAELGKSPLLAEYRSHPKLVKRMPNYRVRIGFGLHSGWAIEGAIGSEFKIDASYLSPNVNTAEGMQKVTKMYGVSILLSGSMHKLLSEEISHECRLIDKVKLAGSKDVTELYTMDLDELTLEVNEMHAAIQSKNRKYKYRQERMQRRIERWADDFHMDEFFRADADISQMRAKFTLEFFCRFKMAYLNYEAGEWSVAKDILQHTRFMLVTEDGPSAALLKFIKQHGPEGWLGYRELGIQ